MYSDYIIKCLFALQSGLMDILSVLNKTINLVLKCWLRDATHILESFNLTWLRSRLILLEPIDCTWRIIRPEALGLKNGKDDNKLMTEIEMPETHQE